MFAQFFRGEVADPTAVHAITRDWMTHHAPIAAADGWLWTTGGVTDDGVLTAYGMFDSPEAARLNGDRPGQNDWWLRLAAQFTGPVVFRNCTWVEIGRAGAHPDSGFVRIVEGRTKDRGRLGVLAGDFDRAMAGVPAELLGFTIAFHDEDPGAFSQLWYFTTADGAARVADPDALSEAADAWMQEVRALSLDVRTVELGDPWMDSLIPTHSWPFGP